MTAAYDYDEAGGEAGWAIAGLRQRVAELEDLLRWRDVWDEPPTKHGEYLVISQEFDGEHRRILDASWNGRWPMYLTVTHWRPIGPLPGE